MLELEAEIYLMREDQGGMTKEGFSGMMPSFRVGDELIMCKVISMNNQDTLQRGKYHKVKIQLPYGDDFKEYISVGYNFILSTGQRIIASGKVMLVL